MIGVISMKEKQIKVLKVAPLEKPGVCYLENDLLSLQKAVSIGADYVGLIEIIDLDEKACILCNEEGKLIGLMPNRQIENDIIFGVFYVTGQDKAGNLTSLTDEQIQYYRAMFADIEYFLRSNDGVFFYNYRFLINSSTPSFGIFQRLPILNASISRL